MSRRGGRDAGDDTLLAGRYRLGTPQTPALDVFAARFSAHDDVLDRSVDVLLLHDGLLADPAATALFAAAVAAPARLTHGAALGIFDAGTSVYRGRTVRWAVREPLRGTSVDGFTPDASLTAEAGSQLVADVAHQVAELLHLLHDEGMTHGNLGPSTVVVASAPGLRARVKVVGFGPQASDLEHAGSAALRAHVLDRFDDSVRYPAPERASGAAPRQAEDIYGFGVLLETLILAVEYVTGPTETLRRLGEIAATARSDDAADRFESAAVLRRAVDDIGGTAGSDELPETRAALTNAGPAEPDDLPTEALAVVRRSKLERRIATATAVQHELTRELPRQRRRRAIRRGTALALVSAATVALLSWSAITSFGPAGSSSASGEGIVLPAVAGHSIDDATRLLVDAGVSPAGQRAQADATAPRGQVLGTDPAAGTALAADSPVTLIVSSGPDLTAVPALVGRSLSDGKAALAASDLLVGEIRKRDGVDAAGTILSTTPVADADAPAGSAVALVVASGRSTIPAGLAGLAPDDAAARLEALGLSVRFRQEPRDDQSAGLVAATNPAAGTSAEHGSVVSVTVAVAVASPPPAAPQPPRSTPGPTPTQMPTQTPTATPAAASTSTSTRQVSA